MKPGLDLIGRAAGQRAGAPPVGSTAAPAASSIDTAAVAKIVGAPGEQTGAVYKMTIGRADLKLTEMGAPINARMGLNTWAGFVGTNAGATGMNRTGFVGGLIA